VRAEGHWRFLLDVLQTKHREKKDAEEKLSNESWDVCMILYYVHVIYVTICVWKECGRLGIGLLELYVVLEYSEHHQWQCQWCHSVGIKARGATSFLTLSSQEICKWKFCKLPMIKTFEQLMHLICICDWSVMWLGHMKRRNRHRSSLSSFDCDAFDGSCEHPFAEFLPGMNINCHFSPDYDFFSHILSWRKFCY